MGRFVEHAKAPLNTAHSQETRRHVYEQNDRRRRREGPHARPSRLHRRQAALARPARCPGGVEDCEIERRETILCARRFVLANWMEAQRDGEGFGSEESGSW